MIVTSTLRMQLDAGNFVKSASQLAEVVDKDVRRLNELKAALKESGASDRLQASMQKLGASATHIEGMRQAMEKFRKEQGTAGKAWSDLTDVQKRSLRDFESATASTMRAVIMDEKDLTAALGREADRRHDMFLTKEQKLKDDILAQDRKAEDKRIVLLAAAEMNRATIANRELVMRSTIEREITTNFKAEVLARENASEAELATIKRIAGLEKEARVRAIQEETAAIVTARDKQQATAAEAVKHGQARAGIGHLVTGTAAGYVSAHAMLRPAELAMEAGAERQSAIINARRAGMTPAEIVRAQGLAVQVARTVGNMTVTQVLELHKEARSAVQHPEEVFELLPDLARAASALKGMGAEGNVADLVKAGESLGLMGDKNRFKKFLDSQVRAQGVMGKTVTTEQTYEAAKYSKSAGSTLSDDFLNLTLPSLIQELHGSSAGDAISGLVKTLRGGLSHQHMAVTQLDKMGLLEDPSKILRAKGSGEILGYTGKVKGDALLASDPDQWFQTVWKPAAEKNMNAMSMADKNLLLSQTLPGKAANLGRIFIQQADTFAQHRENNRNAPGTDEQIRLQREDAKVAVQTFNDALNDLGAAVTGPIMGRVGLGLTDLAGYIRSVEDAALAHPNLALGLGAGATAVGLAGSGWLAYQVSTGFGLPAAAGQLSASAVALETAAGRLGGGNSVKSIVEAAPTAATTVGGAPALAIPGAVTLGAVVLGLGGAAAGAYVVKKAFQAQEPGKGGLWAPATVASAASDRQDLIDLKAEREELAAKVAGQKARERLPGTSDAATSADRDRIAQLDAAIANKQRSLDSLPRFADGGYTGPGSRYQPAGIAHAREFVVNAGATERHRALLEAINRGDILPGYAAGGMVGGSVARIALATDSTSATMLREVMSGAMYDAMRRIRSEGEPGNDGLSVPSLRYGREPDGSYRSAPTGRGSGGSGASAYRGARTSVRRSDVDALHGGWTIGPGDGSATTQDSGPGFTSGMRARNLGNIGYFGQKEAGLVGPSNSRDVDHSIALYATQEDGIRAAARLALRKYQGGKHNLWDLIAGRPVDGKATLSGAWTPGKLGGPASFTMAKALGMTNQDDLRLDQPDHMRKFLGVLARQEHGSAGGFYTPEMIDRALKGGGPVSPTVGGANTSRGIAAEGSRKGFANLMHGQYGEPGQNLVSVTTPGGHRVTVHREAASSFQGFLGDLEKSGYNINSLGGYANRGMAGNPGRISQHAYGNAIDINPAQNPFHTSRTDLPHNVSDMAAKWGLSWGGDWSERSRDPMHFEWTGARPWERRAGPAATAANRPTNMPFGLTGSALEAMDRARAARSQEEHAAAARRNAEEVRARRAAEQAVLPQKPPTATPLPPNASIGLDHSPILAAIEHVDTLHRKLQGLKGVASVDINHKHIHEGEGGRGSRPGALRTSLNGGYASDGRAWT